MQTEQVRTVRTVKAIVQCIPKPESCRLLGISHDAFERHWQVVFSDRRPPNARGKGGRRYVFADELAEACAAGGGVLHGAIVAVKNFRRSIGRL